MTGPRTVLVVDDEESMRDMLTRHLVAEGFKVETAPDGPSALTAARRVQPNLIVLDIMLPGMDGIEVLRRLRETSQVYVLMLTARAEDTDKVVGLTLGADDYLTKPFSPRELIARVKAVLRRQRGPAERPPVLEFPRLRIDPGERRVWKDGAEISLTSLEFDLLGALASHPRLVLTRPQLIEKVWGADFYGDERVVDVHIKELRRKLEDDPAHPALVTTVRNIGYRFEGR